MDAVERHVTLPTDLEETWTLLTRPEDQAGWLGAEVELDPTPGAAGRVVDHDGTRRALAVEQVEEGRHLTWRWWPEDGGTESRVEVTLTPDGEGTRVTVVECPLAPTAAATTVQASAGAAWSHRLLHLEALLLLAAAVRG